MNKVTYLISLFFFSILSLAAQVNLDQGLVLCLPFDGDLKDQSGFGNDGNNRGATLTQDRFGNDNSAFFFNGTDTYVEVPFSPSLNVEDISIALWIKPTAFKAFTNSTGVWPRYAGPISKDLSPPSTWNGFSTTTQHGLLRFANFFDTGKYGNVGIENEISLNEWQFLVFIIDNGILKIYKNAVLKGTDNRLIGVKMIQNVNPILIGRSIWFPSNSTLNAFFTGSIDDINIYNRGLSQEEIDILYNGKEPTFEPVSFNVSPNQACIGEEVKITAITTDTNLVYKWKLEGENIGSNENFIIVQLDPSLTKNVLEIELTTIKTEGCLPPTKNELPFQLSVDNCQSSLKQIHLPTAFSPNSDGLNDVFDISILSHLQPQKIEFYNRWGNKITTLSSPVLDWNGEIGDNKAPPGIYSYVITFSSGVQQSGSITLVR